MRVPRNRYPRLLVLFGAAALLVLVAATSFWVGRAFSDDGPAAATDPTPSPAPTTEPGASPTPIPTFPGNEITPPPDATPDTSQPFWWVPYQNVDQMKPRFTGEVAGILVGPDVRQSVACSPGEAVTGDETDVTGTPLELAPSYLPPGATLEGQDVALCRDHPLYNSVTYYVPEDRENGIRGGGLVISRQVGDAAIDAAFPEDRWTTLEIQGRTFAIGLPILSEIGLGPSVALLYEDPVLTIVWANDLPLDELLAIVEGLFQ